jgi:recombinational DNA repair protein RecT
VEVQEGGSMNNKNEIKLNKNELQAFDNYKKTLQTRVNQIANDLPKDLQTNLLVAKYENHFLKQIEKERKKGNSSTLEAIANNPEDFALITLNFISLNLQPGTETNVLPFGGILTPHIDYKAEIKLLLQYSIKTLKNIQCYTVFENDIFEFDKNKVVAHSYDPFGDEKSRGKARGCYAIFTLENGEEDFQFISMKEIIDVKKISPGSSSALSPWNAWPERMWHKTLIKKSLKWYPLKIKNDLQTEALNTINNLSSPFIKKDDVITYETNQATEKREMPKVVLEAEEVTAEVTVSKNEKKIKKQLSNIIKSAEFTAEEKLRISRGKKSSEFTETDFENALKEAYSILAEKELDF